MKTLLLAAGIAALATTAFAQPKPTTFEKAVTPPPGHTEQDLLRAQSYTQGLFPMLYRDKTIEPPAAYASERAKR